MVAAMPSHVLVVGGDGVIGSALVSYLRMRGMFCFATSRQKKHDCGQNVYLDFEQDISRFTPPFSGGYTILAAGISQLERCEKYTDQTSFINVQQTLALAKKLAQCGNRLIFLSSSHVFAGTQKLPATDFPVNPLTQYGRQKVAVEVGLQSIQPEAVILRLSKVIHPELSLFRQWHDAWSQGISTTAFMDMWAAPVALVDVICVICQIMQENWQGVYHISPHEEWCYYDIAMYLADTLGYDTSLVRGVSAGARLPAAFRPRHVALESSATWKHCGGGGQIPKITQALALYIQRELFV